jgi:hypothetical protein
MRPLPPWRRRSLPAAVRAALCAVVCAVVLVTGCTWDGTLPTPDPTDDPKRAAAELATGLGQRDLTKVEFTGATGSAVNAQFEPLVDGMARLRPSVKVTGVDVQGDAATVSLAYVWSFPGVPASWSYQTTAGLAQTDGRWRSVWDPSLVHPQLNGANRLTQRRLEAPRGELLGDRGEAIMIERPVVRIGIDKSALETAEQSGSATRLARLVGIDAERYVKEVADAGPEAFVEAIVLRADSDERPDDEAVRAIPGALPILGEQVLAPTRDFARPVIGTVGEASKEIVDESKGAVVSGDQVGLSGLQKRYDTALRGTPGVEVRLVAPKKSASPSPGATPSGGPTDEPTDQPTSQPSGSPSPSATPAKPVTVFEAKPVAGKDLTITLSVPLQKLAEKVLARTKPAAALVAIRPSTGAVVAAANGSGTEGYSVATVGQAPPGSTFKVATTLALLRAGLDAGSRVSCPARLFVDGKPFVNYSDYPSSALGSITLETAVAQSCNTAFIGQRSKIKPGELASAASSLGVGTDYDVGFGSYFGSVPRGNTGPAGAANLIGQGEVLASPLAMASVVASVAGGRTVLPQLVSGTKATSKAEPLTSAEARQLRTMMRAVVTQGSGRLLDDLPGPAVIAKTGTAEYGDDEPRKTHAWMIAAQGDLAVAVFVQDGESGSKTAGPLLRAFLAGAR